MTTTTYYNLNIAEGTDIVNPLTVDNPNYQKIDETMHDNAVAGVTLATEIANATVHAITRENSDCSVIRFIATSQWKAGDTATVDGVPVTALLPSGETLPDGAYVINANVLCILTGTNLTVYVEGKKAGNANEITFNDTTVAAELVSLDEEAVRLDGEVTRLNGEVTRLDGEISNLDTTKNDLDTVVDITSLCVDNFYTFESDGYLVVETDTAVGSEIIARFYGSTSDNYVRIFAYCNAQFKIDSNTIFVRKGMRVKREYMNGTSYIRFAPLK